ncbi:ATP-dependent zinc metalloprotease FtsH [Colletotrichum orbiculare MAFF 240422]|uniref:ATP-dependent zinc metalloprotease FtsH n=1 Tax=Colletotrichum orbiculare (strain 104-T / ATCC 96160 / CBS 514.97 / LARS 414 / MAFF 240422) TaxID=1213857 RepID=N4V7C5_COLOR|nr:ATP-dependent zinc metalloprotease FtsH [Colletotrichum orbiculare MAFF 240422]
MAPGSTTAEALGLTLVDDTKAPAKKKTHGAVEATNGKDTNGSGKPASKKATEVESSTDAAVANTKKDLAPVGSISTTKNIYRSPKDKDGNCTWVDKYPEDAVDAAENAETAQYAVVVRNIKSPDSRKKLEAHSILVQSPWLKEALGHILQGYTGVACELERLEFEAPFRPFVHRWAEFRTYMKQDGLDDRTRQHLEVLHDILQYEIGDSIRAFEDYVAKGVVTFEHLWMIFQPGAVVVSAHKGPLSAFELEETEYKESQCLGHFLRVKADCVDYSGKKFGRAQERINVVEFLGTKKITSLDAYPLAFHPDRDQLRAALVRRGRVFEGLAGHHYKQYAGTAITWDREGNEVPVQVDGRIVVDINSFNRFSPYRPRHVADWTAKDVEALAAWKRQHGAGTDGTLKLTPYHQMLARSRTRGYSLKLKKWLDFFVDDVGEITWNTDAFDKLVLPEDQKELILAFSESQLDGSDFDDVISGKGKGIICLLSGPPGVGKTLTAEAVAENLRVPLHTLSSGDLGSQPWEVESGLARILELVARWDAILLLDECDVFLEARSAHDLERNKVVSIFLRTLEYYEGILFMTTNRVGNIDAAFRSRIHVSLEYPDLTAGSRRQIWRNFLQGSAASAALGADVLSEADVDELAELPLNGRQIKNVLKTSQLLAARKKSPLKRCFIDTVLSIEKRRPGGQDA